MHANVLRSSVFALCGAMALTLTACGSDPEE